MAHAKKPPPRNTEAYIQKGKEMALEKYYSEKGSPTELEAPRESKIITQQTIDDICLHIAEFGEPMEVVCLRKGMPEVSSVRKYCGRNPEAKEQVENARLGGVYTLACNLRKVAKGETGHSSKDVNRDKLIVDTEFKILRAIAPKEFGDKQAVAIEGKFSLEQIVLDSFKPLVIEADS